MQLMENFDQKGYVIKYLLGLTNWPLIKVV